MNKEDNAIENFKLRNIFLIFIGYIALSFVLYLHFAQNLYINMLWNVFLAFIPLIFSIWIFRLHVRYSWPLKLVLGFFWLIFFPNALYMITDFIHISGDDFYLGREEYSQVIVSTDMTLWIRVAYIGIGVLMAILAGLLSLRMIHQVLSRKLGVFSSGIMLSIVFLLTGIGIYLGRFLRLNSWNIVHLRSLLRTIYNSISVFSIKFILLYSFFAFVSYVVFYTFCPMKMLDNNSSQ